MEKEKSPLDYTVYIVSVHVPPSHKPQFCLKQVSCGKLLKETSHCFCENIFGPIVRLPDVPAVPCVTHLVCWDTRHNSVIPERYQTFLSACEGFHERYVYFAFTTLFIILLINLLFPPVSDLRFSSPCFFYWLTSFHNFSITFETLSCNLEDKLLRLWHSPVTLAGWFMDWCWPSEVTKGRTMEMQQLTT